MLKKRILASSMASVMALSSVSVVAFADETASSINTEAVTKAQLKEYVADLEDFIDDDLEAYGSVQSEQFEAAYEAAKAVVGNSDATADDATAAYQMLKAVKESLKMYTNEELKELVNDNKSKYDTDNKLNEDFGDLIYDSDSFKKFAAAYDAAEGSIDDDDQRVINDAYTDLENAVKGLKENKKITKAQFRTAYNAYIDLVNNFDKYESWRRGTATVGVKTGKLMDDTDAELNFEGKTVTYGELKGILYDTSKTIPASMKKTYGSKTWIKMIQIGTETTVADNIEAAYDKFIGNEKSNVTTLDSIVTAYNAAVDAVKVFEGWEVDNVKRGSKSACYDLIDSYRDKILPEVYTADTVEPVATLKTSVTGTEGDSNVVVTVTAGKVVIDCTSASMSAQEAKFSVNKDTGWLTLDPSDASKYKYDSTATIISIKKGEKLDITKYLPINATIVGNKLDTAIITAFDFEDAFKALEAVVALDESSATTKDYSAVSVIPASINDNGAVIKTSLKSAAYPLVYRALAYTLADKFPKEDEYKKKDVADLIKKANQLIDDTGDAAMFKINNAALDLARKAATEWVAKANADKTFKDDGTNLEYADGKYENGDIKGSAGGANATTVYKTLNTAYKALKDQFARYPYSYGDVADTIVEVAEGLDDGAYGTYAASIKAAATDIAFDLSTLNDFKVTENVIYDDDRNFIAYNRLDSDGTNGEKALYKKYTALLAAVEEAEKEPEAPEVVKGDLTGDGVATPEDAIMIVKAFVGEITLTDAQQAAADFNGDGVVNADDALAVVKAYVGL